MSTEGEERLAAEMLVAGGVMACLASSDCAVQTIPGLPALKVTLPWMLREYLLIVTQLPDQAITVADVIGEADG